MKLQLQGNSHTPQRLFRSQKGAFRSPAADLASCFAARSLISGNAELETCRNPI